MPLVTIIIPVYNTAKYLKTCLNSVINQTYKNIEIIIIDDCSPDKANIILKEYEQSFRNIKVIHNQINLGLAATRNIGLEKAQGDFILFIDSDDYIDITTVEKMINLVKEYHIDLVQFDYTNILGPIKLEKKQVKEKPFIEDISKSPNLLLDKTGHCWRNFYNHSLIEELKFPEGVIYEDNAFTYPTLTKAGKILRFKKVLYYYRRNLNSITIKNKIHPNEKILDIFKATDYIKYNCKQIGTYDSYSDIINQIMIAKSLIPTLSATTWFQIKKEDKVNLIKLLFQYSQSHYSFNSLEDITSIENRRQIDKLYNMRIQYLQNLLNEGQYIEIDEEKSLEEARKIIKKYQTF